jgi:hypothetical protein
MFCQLHFGSEDCTMGLHGGLQGGLHSRLDSGRDDCLHDELQDELLLDWISAHLSISW